MQNEGLCRATALTAKFSSCLFVRGQKRLCLTDNITAYILEVGQSIFFSSKIALDTYFSSPFYIKKGKTRNTQTAANHTRFANLAIFCQFKLILEAASDVLPSIET